MCWKHLQHTQCWKTCGILSLSDLSHSPWLENSTHQSGWKSSKESEHPGERWGAAWGNQYPIKWTKFWEAGLSLGMLPCAGSGYSLWENRSFLHKSKTLNQKTPVIRTHKEEGCLEISTWFLLPPPQRHSSPCNAGQGGGTGPPFIPRTTVETRLELRDDTWEINNE